MASDVPRRPTDGSYVYPGGGKGLIPLVLGWDRLTERPKAARNSEKRWKTD